MTIDLPFRIYIYLNGHTVLDDRTATGVANAMRVSKDTAGDHLQKMVTDKLLVSEKVGNARVYFIHSVIPNEV